MITMITSLLLSAPSITSGLHAIADSLLWLWWLGMCHLLWLRARELW